MQTQQEAAAPSTRGAAPEFVLRLDRSFRILYLCPATERAIGLPAAAVLGRSYPELMEAGLYAGLREDLYAFLEAALDRAVAVGEEIRLRLPSARNGVMEYRIAPEREASGAVASLLLVVRSAAAEQRAEAALRESEERYRLVAHATQDVIYDLDLERRTLYWNEALERVLGYVPEETEPTMEWWSERLHPEDRERVERSLAGALEGDAELWSEEYRFLRADGGYAHVLERGRIARDPAGRPVRVIGSITDRSAEREADRALRESEAKFRQLAENIREIFWMFDPAFTRMDYVSPMYEEVWGQSLESLAGDAGSFLGSIHEADRARLVAAMERVGGGAQQTVEYRVVRPDGTVRWVCSRGFPVLDADGRVHRVVGTTEDGEVWGQAEETLAGDAGSFLRSVHEADRARLAAAMERVGGGAPVTVEYRVVRPDGTVRWVCSRGFPVFDADGSVHRVVGTTEDVTERRRAEEALRQSEAFSRSVLESSTDCIEVLDLEGRLVSMNGPGRALLEIEDFPSIRGMDWREFWEGAARGAAERALAAARGGGVGHFDGPCPTAKGTPKWWDVMVTPIRGGSGAVERLLCLSRDVTEQRRLEEELRQAQKMEAVGRLAGGVAHDFNNLLTAIRGHTQLVRELTAGDEEVQEDLEVVASAVDRATALTSQLLAFSRREVLQPTTVSLNRTIAETERMLRRTIGAHIELVTELEPELGAVRADACQMSQVVLNLAVNARDAMPMGGRLLLRTANVEVGRGAEPAPGEPGAGRWVRVEVCDTGCGMDAETRTRAFEPFFTTKGPGEGTGLGLSTVYGIVHQLGGCIHFHTEPGRGTTFVVHLPRTSEGPAPADAAPREADGGLETVLVAEDDPLVRRLVRSVLGRAGYRVLEASSAPEALELHASAGGPVDLLLTDVVMPGMSGRTLAERVASHPAAPPVLFMSGYTEDAVLKHGVLEGQRFLRKPFTPDDLLRGVREVLDGTPRAAARA